MNQKISEFDFRPIKFDSATFIPYVKGGINFKSSTKDFATSLVNSAEFQQALGETGLAGNPIYSLVPEYEFALSDNTYLIKLAYDLDPTEADKYYNPLFEIGNTVASLSDFYNADNATIVANTSVTNRPYKNEFYTALNSLIPVDEYYYLANELANEGLRYWTFVNSVPPITALTFNALTLAPDSLGALLSPTGSPTSKALIKANTTFTPPTTLYWTKSQGNKNLKSGTITTDSAQTNRPITSIDFVGLDKPSSFVAYETIAGALTGLPTTLAVGQRLQWKSIVQDSKLASSQAIASIVAVVPIYTFESVLVATNGATLATALGTSFNNTRFLAESKVTVNKNMLGNNAGNGMFHYVLVPIAYADYNNYSIDNQTPETILNNGTHLLFTVTAFTIDGLTQDFKVYRSIAQQGLPYNLNLT